MPLAPLHNPANLAGIAVARELLPDVPQVAVFDTAFHATMPRGGVDVRHRRGGRRARTASAGTASTAPRTRTCPGAPPSCWARPPTGANVITLHLGNGASACAVRGGRSVATSMGMSPLAGLVMGTRSGDLDPAVVFHLHRVGGMTAGRDRPACSTSAAGCRAGRRQRHAGRCSAAGPPATRPRRSRSTSTAAGSPSTSARTWRCWGGVDAITFTAGVGRELPGRTGGGAGRAGRRWASAVDSDRNAGGELVISPEGSPVTVCVVPTAEELEIATQARAAIA